MNAITIVTGMQSITSGAAIGMNGAGTGIAIGTIRLVVGGGTGMKTISAHIPTHPDTPMVSADTYRPAVRE